MVFQINVSALFGNFLVELFLWFEFTPSRSNPGSRVTGCTLELDTYRQLSAPNWRERKGRGGRISNSDLDWVVPRFGRHDFGSLDSRFGPKSKQACPVYQGVRT